MDVRSIFERVKPVFEQYRNEEHIEFEVRIGKFNCGTFDTNVGKTEFETILDGLKRYDGWERVVSTAEEVFYRESDNLRISIDENTSEEKIVQKDKLYKEDFDKLVNAPFDIRFGVSVEIPIEDYEGEMDKKKMKRRMSFVRKNLSIDMTIVQGDVEDLDTEDPNSYQIELEIIDPKLVKDDNELFNILHKVKDLFNILNTSR
jgi:hypothetical protein